MKKETEADPLDREFSLDTLPGKGVRGKYYSRVSKGSNVVRLAPEVARLFPTEEAVNRALLSLVELSKSLPHPPRRPSGRAKGSARHTP